MIRGLEVGLDLVLIMTTHLLIFEYIIVLFLFAHACMTHHNQFYSLERISYNNNLSHFQINTTNHIH